MAERKNMNDIMVRSQLDSALYWHKEANKRKRISFDFFNNAILISIFSYNEGEGKFNKKKDKSFTISENKVMDLITIFKKSKEAYKKGIATTYVTSNRKSAFGVAIYEFEGEKVPCLVIFECNDGMLLEGKRSVVPFRTDNYSSVKELKDEGKLEDVKTNETEFMQFADKMVEELEDVFYGRSLRHNNHKAKYGKAISENQNGDVSSYQKAEATTDDDSDEFPF